MPIVSFARQAGANGSSVVVGKAVLEARRIESGWEESKEMVGWHWHVFALHFEACYSSILVTNTTHHLPTYARVMDSERHVIRTAY